jgi:hypothetical protein
MGDVVRGTWAPESVPEFVARSGHVVNTVNVARRFGWNVDEARVECNRLVDAGQLVCVGLDAAEDAIRVLSWATPGYDWGNVRHLGRKGILRVCPFCNGSSAPGLNLPRPCDNCGALLLANWECVPVLAK